MELLAQLAGSESPREILTAAHQLRLIQAKAAVLFPSAAEVDAALGTGIPHLVALLGRTAGGVVEEGEEEEAAVAVRSLEMALQAYDAEGSSPDERARLAEALLEAQSTVKRAFERKGASGGGGGS
jgi:hypothetical protein